MCWLTGSEFCLFQDRIFGVFADALGGINNVKFFGDCATTTLTTPIVHTYTDAAGNTQTLLGYFINLKAALWYGAHNVGSVAQIWAQATANDGTMQTRIIGNSAVTGSPVFKTDYPMLWYPRSAESDFAHTIGPVTGTYPDIPAFTAAAGAAGAERPIGTFVDTGFYELGYTAAFYGPFLGQRMVLTNGANAKATLRRSTPFDPENVTGSGAAAANYWRNGWSGGIELRNTGPNNSTNGLWIDQRNVFGGIFLKPNGCWLNGCRIINSDPHPFTYCNGLPAPTWNFSDDNGNPNNPFSTATIYEDIGNSMAFAPLCLGLKIRNCLASLFDDSDFVIGTYSRDCDSEIIHGPKNAMTVIATGVGAATIQITHAAQSDPAVITLVDSNGTQTVNPGLKPSDGNMLISDVVATINARIGWTAVTLDPNTVGAQFLESTAGGAPVSVASLLTLPVAVLGLHAEWWHNNSSGGTRQNVVHWGNVSTNCVWSTGVWDGENSLQDAIVKGNAWSCGSDNGAGGGVSGINNQFSASSHVVYCNNYIDTQFALFTGLADVYTLVGQNAFTNISSVPINSYPALNDNAFGGALPTQPNPPYASGNFQLTGGDFAALVINATVNVGDFRPNTSGKYFSNLKTALDPIDGRGNLRNPAANSEAIGPWAIGYSVPTYFDFAA